MKRVVLIVIGVILLIGGVLLAIGGGVLMGAFGTNNSLTSGAHRVTTPTSALVARMDDIGHTHGFATSVGRPTLRVSVTGAGPNVFVGIGPAAAVDNYLANAAYDRVTDLDVNPFRLTTVRHQGSARPASPAAQTFWTVRASGSSATIKWKITDGSYRLVLMNADATPGVAVDSRFGLTIPHIFQIGIGILIAGIVFAVFGVILLVLGIRTRPPAVQPAPAAAIQ